MYIYLISYFNIYVISLLTGLSSIVFVLSNSARYQAVTTDIILLSIFLGFMCVLMVSSVSIMIARLSDTVKVIQHLKYCTQQQRQLMVGLQSSYSFPGPNGTNCGQTFWKRVSVALILTITALLIITLVLPFIGVYAGLDPYRFSVGALFPKFYQIPVFSTLVRFFLSFVCVNEACRFLAFYLSLAVYFVELLFSFLASFPQVPFSDYSLFLKWHKIFQLVFNSFQGTISDFFASLMGCGFAIFVTSNVETFKCFGILPLAVYIIFPFCSTAGFIVVYLCLPFAVFVAETTRKNIRERRAPLLRRSQSKLRGSQNKRLRKEFNCVKPIIINCGSFYPLVRGAESNYYFYIMLRTSDVLLTVNNLNVFGSLEG